MYKPLARESIRNTSKNISMDEDKSLENSTVYQSPESDISDDDLFDLDGSLDSSNSSADFTRSLNSSGQARNRSRQVQPEADLSKQSKNPRSFEKIPEQEEVQHSIIYRKIFFFVILPLILAIAALGVVNSNVFIAQAGTNQLSCEIPRNFARIFNENEQISIKSAIDEIKTFKKPSVLMLIHPKSSNSQSKSTANEKLQAIIDYSTCKLNSGNDYVEITQREMHTPEIIADKGLLITRYKDKLEDLKVLVVRNVQDTPGEVAMVFHFLCDEYTPVVASALIIFTLEFEETDELRRLSDFNIVEKVLNDQWRSKMRPDDIPPLITRITSDILRI